MTNILPIKINKPLLPNRYFQGQFATSQYRGLKKQNFVYFLCFPIRYFHLQIPTTF